jgi:hypothetical protein
MKPGELLEAWLDRRPLLLFPELAERGLAYRCDQRADGSYVVRIATREEQFGD